MHAACLNILTLWVKDQASGKAVTYQKLFVDMSDYCNTCIDIIYVYLPSCQLSLSESIQIELMLRKFVWLARYIGILYIANYNVSKLCGLIISLLTYVPYILCIYYNSAPIDVYIY